MSTNYKPKHILITGGAGFIGSHMIRYLLTKNDDIKVINLDKLTYAASKETLDSLAQNECHHFIHGDICDHSLVSKLLTEYQIDTIIHFAAESHVDRSIENPDHFIESNIIGTYTLLQAARTYWMSTGQLNHHECRFHHISTDEVYGTLQPNDPEFSETSVYAPNSPYSASKASSDHLVRAYFHTYHLPITMSHCSNNYGTYQHTEKFIPTIIRSCIEQKPIPVYGDGQQIRDWLYVVDHCKAIDKIIRFGTLGDKYNIGGQNEWTNLEVVKLICDLMDQQFPQTERYQSLIQFVKDRPGHDRRYAMNIDKISHELAWIPETAFKQGLKKTIQFYCRSLLATEEV